MYPVCIVMIFIASAAAVSVVNVENDDGSYSVGGTAQTRGNTADSVYALLTKATGWTDASTNYQQEDEPKMRQNVEFSSLIQTTSLPYSEILRILEAFVRLKGEVASRIGLLISDNADILRAVGSTLISKIGVLHKFTLIGLVVLRKVVEFAAQLFGQWSVNVDVNQVASSFF